jgi:hypothetical protein
MENRFDQKRRREFCEVCPFGGEIEVSRKEECFGIARREHFACLNIREDFKKVRSAREGLVWNELTEESVARKTQDAAAFELFLASV